MPRKNEPMTTEQMDAVESSRSGNKLNSKKANISGAIQSAASVFEALPPEVDLNDADTVHSSIVAYLRKVSEYGTHPNLTGLARTMGYDRQSLYRHMERSPGSATTRYLKIAQDVFAEMLEQRSVAMGILHVDIFCENKVGQGVEQRVERDRL